MKANELMIGDFIKHGFGGVGKVTELSKGIITVYDDGLNDGDGDCEVNFAENEIQPINLTQVILEKNGLCKDNYGRLNGEFFDEDENRDLEITVDDKTGEIWWSYNWDEYRVIRLRYVHELQHALRLCGIEKEIIL